MQISANKLMDSQKKKRGGTWDDRMSLGTSHHMWQLLHLICPWPGPAEEKADYGGNSKEKQTWASPSSQGSILINVHFHWDTCSWVLQSPKKDMVMSTLHRDTAVSTKEDRTPLSSWTTTTTKGESTTLKGIAVFFHIIDQYCHSCKGQCSEFLCQKKQNQFLSDLVFVQVTSVYACKRMTACWPLVVLYIIFDASAFNYFILWTEIDAAWNQGKCRRRRLFLEELGWELVTLLIKQRQVLPRTSAAASLVVDVQQDTSSTSAAAPPCPASPPEPSPTRPILPWQEWHQNEHHMPKMQCIYLQKAHHYDHTLPLVQMKAHSQRDMHPVTHTGLSLCCYWNYSEKFWKI